MPPAKLQRGFSRREGAHHIFWVLRPMESSASMTGNPRTGQSAHSRLKTPCRLGSHLPGNFHIFPSPTALPAAASIKPMLLAHWLFYVPFSKPSIISIIYLAYIYTYSSKIRPYAGKITLFILSQCPGTVYSFYKLIQSSGPRQRIDFFYLIFCLFVFLYRQICILT